MARSLLTDTRQDLIDDSGSVLWSIVKGEQLEFPVEIEFLTNVLLGYQFECVVVEANNVALQEEYPTDIQLAGIQTVLSLRLPDYVGLWEPTGVYDAGNTVLHDDIYYELSDGLAYSSTALPNVDTNWELAKMNQIYVQFPSTLGSDWNVQPMVNHPTYGFFELRVTEPVHYAFRKTWKPVRGMVQLLFSPTHIVPD
jgi:hypothetical protein